LNSGEGSSNRLRRAIVDSVRNLCRLCVMGKPMSAGAGVGGQPCAPLHKFDTSMRRRYRARDASQHQSCHPRPPKTHSCLRRASLCLSVISGRAKKIDELSPSSVDFGETNNPVDSSETGESLADCNQLWCHGRPARLQDHALVDHIHVGPRINGQGHRKCLGPLVFEVVGLAIRGTELAL